MLGASYTQRSLVANRGESSPFRETNYEPQLFGGRPITAPVDAAMLKSALTINPTAARPDVAQLESRLCAADSANGNWQVDLKPWFRFSELEQRRQPGHHKYMGYYRLKVGYA